MKTYKLTDKNLVNKYLKSVGKTHNLAHEIILRIEYVINQIYAEYQASDVKWCFKGKEMDIDDLVSGICGDDVRYKMIQCRGVYDFGPMIIFLKDGTEYDLGDKFPLRWLFEDFERELTKGGDKYVREVVVKKKKSEEKQEDEKRKVRKEVLKKLTKKEIKILGL